MKYAKIGLFTVIFCVTLAALIAICIWAFSRSSTEILSFRPIPTEKEDPPFLWFKRFDKENVQMWMDNISQFLSQYYTPGKAAKDKSRIKRCSHSDYPGPREVCDVDVKDWGECNPSSRFGYDTNSPCLFFMLNKIYEWTPEYYDNPNDLPDEMPEQLKQVIYNTRERQNVWLSCEGEYPADRERLEVSYYPFPGFPGYYFPYLNTEGYLRPLVAVKFERLPPGVIISVECRAWAKNIPYNKAEGTGYVNFLLFTD